MITNIYQSAYRYPFAYVGFGGNATRWWTKFLKKGFYHCLLLLGNGREWILIDPVAHYTDLILIKKKDVLQYFKEQGYRFLRTTPQIYFSFSSLNLRRSRETFFRHHQPLYLDAFSTLFSFNF